MKAKTACEHAGGCLLELALFGFEFSRRDLEPWRILQRLLHLAQLRRTDQRAVILFRKRGWDLNLKFDRIGVDALNDADALGGQVALAAKAEDVDSRARAERGEK